MAVTAAEFKEYKTKVECHDEFINGVQPNGQDGAKTRLTRIEDSLSRRDKASNMLIVASLSVIGGIVIWLIKDVIVPALVK